MIGATSRVQRIFTICVASALICSLVGCGTDVQDAAGRTVKDSEVSVNPESEEGARTAPEYSSNIVLPETFPSDQFSFPSDAVIEDTGERGEGVWYLVFRAPDEASADSLWHEIIATNNLVIEDQDQTVEGGIYAKINAPLLMITAMTIPQEDGSVLISYDLVRWGE